MYAIFNLVMIKHNKKLNLTRFQYSIIYYLHAPNIVKLYLKKWKKSIVTV